MRQYHFGHSASSLSSTGHFPLNLSDTPTSYHAAKYLVVAAGTLRNLRVRLTTAPGAGTSWDVTLYKNNSATAITLSIADAATSASDTSNTASVAVGDTVSYLFTRNGATASTDASSVIEFVSTTANECWYAVDSARCDTTARYIGTLGSCDTFSAFSSGVMNLIPLAGTITRMDVELTQAGAPDTPQAPGTGTSKSFTIYKNGVAQDGTGGTVNTTVTISNSSTSGSTTFELALVRGDYVYTAVTLSGSPASSDARIGVKFVSSNDTQFPICGVVDNWNTDDTFIHPVITLDDGPIASGSETVAYTTGPVTSLTITGMIGRLTSAPGTGDTRTFAARLNGANAGPTLTMSNAETTDEDSTNTFTLTSTDTWNVRQTTTGTPDNTNVAIAFLGDSSDYAQKVTATWVEVFIDEEADADPPPSVTACSGSGTVASGTNPAAGTALSTMTQPIAWVEVVAGGTTYYWGKVAVNGPSFRIEPRVKSFGRLNRALSDGKGSFETGVLSLRLSDTDRTLRGLMNSAVLINQPISAYVADTTTIMAGSAARRVFHGVIRRFRPVSRLEFEIVAEDRFTFGTSAFAQEKKVPARLITSAISDQNPTDRVIDKPVPLIYGSCSDESETTPVGVVPCLYIASETPDEWDDNLHKFLVCGHALKNIQAVYLADYISGGDNPTTRIKAPASAYGDILFVPHQTGWFGAGNYTDQNSERYTFIYGLDGHPAIELARTGRIPLLVNVCGIESTGDSTGTMLSNPARCFLHALNNKVAQEATANWLSILSLGTYTLFDTTAIEAVATICTARGYLCAGIIGEDYSQMNWRELGARFCSNFDFDWGVNRHGQIILAMVDYGDPYSSATTFTDQTHVLQDSLEIDPQHDEVENEVQYVYERNYAEALHAIVRTEGSRPERDPYDGKWYSGLQRLSDEDVITDMGGRPMGLRQSKVQEYDLIRDSATADDVAARRLALRKLPRSLVTFAVTLKDGDGTELGDVIKLTHFQGVSSTGWTGRRLQVRRIEDDLDAFTRTFTARDIEDLFGDVTFLGEDVEFDGVDVTFTPT